MAEKNRKWREKNKHRVAYYAAQRRSALAKRTPPWIDDNDLAQMQAFFAESRRLSLATGVLHHVDHIEPLRGLDASGLNVPWNLQVLTATENLKKGNRRVKT
ncbi:MAG: HNH endonuclease signature motif containing protein [Pseudomonas sp.]